MRFPDSSITRVIRTIDEATWLVDSDFLPPLDLAAPGTASRAIAASQGQPDAGVSLPPA